ncbi:MAG TPA: SDR family oxidoreductase [Flavobacteriaceae bacterium]|nr:SDR family oxidoreductase [Flavobacteriaceae bacterium]HIP26979.1 SDR family oxidoreductase [Flavobacteriaceae bacterium]
MNKVVLITGASSGIGKSIGEYLHKKGYIVYGTSRSPEKYSNSIFTLLKLDVNDIDSIKKAINQIVEKEGKIDVLINNAGKGITGPLEETPIIEMKKTFDTNFFGVMQVCNSVLPQMRKQNKGLIINITSIAGDMGLPYRGIYSASKAALSVYTEALRLETKQFNIDVVDVAPGDFATNIAAGRFHTPLFEKSAYKKHYSKVLEQINDEVDEGLQPIIMAKAIAKIIKKSSPKPKYRIGSFLQRIAYKIKFLLPDTVFEKIMIKQYEL